MQAPQPDDDAEYLARYVARSQQIIRDLHAAREAVRQLEGRAESRDRRVQAAADGQGGVILLRIDPRALRLGEQELGRQVTEVIRAAQADAERQARGIADRVAADAAALPAPLDETFVRRRVEQAAQDLF
ncbi:YbaB/EbfC family nucleoid-associated protein [Planomonospora algeriensis]